jgi:hypothetical protein
MGLLTLVLFLLVPHAPSSESQDTEPARAAISRRGVLGGASYLIEVPSNWHGGLVVWAHGIQQGPGLPTVDAPPIASHIVAEGHAWAASSYRAREYQPHLFIEDLVALREPSSTSWMNWRTRSSTLSRAQVSSQRDAVA